MTEGATSSHHPDVPPPLNPWNHGHQTGASSSGSAVATAAGLCFGSLGSETVCSIRLPAAFCGVVGLKPTCGRVSRAGVFPLAGTLDHVGPLTRTVADAAAMLGVIAGADENDQTAMRLPVPDYLAALSKGASGLRIGVDEAFMTEGVLPELAKAVAATIEVLKQQGAEICQITMPSCQDALPAAANILHASVAHVHRDLLPGREADYGDHLREVVEIGLGMKAADVAAGEEVRRQWIGQLSELFETIDLVISPTVGSYAPVLRPPEYTRSDFRDEALLRYLNFTFPYTLSGNPAITIPCGMSEDGLPLVFQLIARPFEEAALLRAGHAYQQATNWHAAHPPNLD